MMFVDSCVIRAAFPLFDCMSLNWMGARSIEEAALIVNSAYIVFIPVESFEGSYSIKFCEICYLTGICKACREELFSHLLLLGGEDLSRSYLQRRVQLQ